MAVYAPATLFFMVVVFIMSTTTTTVLAQVIQPFLQISTTPDTCVEVCSFVDSRSDASDDWFQRVGSPFPRMSHPIMKFRYCEYPSETSSTKTCSGTELSHTDIRDGKDFDAFYDEVRSSDGGETVEPTHTAVGHSRAGTVCFYSFRWRNSSGGCRVHCVGLQNDGERHEIALSGSSDLPTLQHVEVWFEENPDRCQIQAEIEKEEEEKKSHSPKAFDLITTTMVLAIPFMYLQVLIIY